MQAKKITPFGVAVAVIATALFLGTVAWPLWEAFVLPALEAFGR